jgi:hypothetical protein
MQAMRPVTLVRGLVEADAVCARCSTDASGLVICVEMKTVDEIAGLIIEATKGVVGRLLNGTCNLLAQVHHFWESCEDGSMTARPKNANTRILMGLELRIW